MSRPPKELYVSPHTFDVRKAPTDLLSSNGALGSTEEDTAIIWYDERQSDTKLKDTVLHEAMHALWNQTYLDVTYPDGSADSPGEAIIAELAPRLLALLRDNPAFAEWLIEGSE